MAQKTYRDAVRDALREEMLRDENVLIMGEEVGVWGGTYAVTRGLYGEFGDKRILDTPIAEEAIVGTAVGAAMGGLRPVAELMTINFSLVAMDQIVNNVAKIHSMFGGQARVPLVIRDAGRWGQLGDPLAVLRSLVRPRARPDVVMPSTPATPRGCSRPRSGPTTRSCSSSMRGYGIKGEVPDGEYTLPIGASDVKRAGRDVTIVSCSRMLHVALGAAGRAREDGIECEVIDLRTLRPLDLGPVTIRWKRRTGRHRRGGLDDVRDGREVRRASARPVRPLDAPVERMGQVEVPMPYAKTWKRSCFPTKDRSPQVMKMVA